MELETLPFQGLHGDRQEGVGIALAEVLGQRVAENRQCAVGFPVRTKALIEGMSGSGEPFRPDARIGRGRWWTQFGNWSGIGFGEIVGRITSELPGQRPVLKVQALI